jgi:hypothetical protein
MCFKIYIMSKKKQIRKDYWTCIIGATDKTKLQDGADSPMRNAVETAYQKVTGSESDVLYSGWGTTEDRMKVINAVSCMEENDPIYTSIVAMLKGSNRLD